jgi:hypothetical protein
MIEEQMKMGAIHAEHLSKKRIIKIPLSKVTLKVSE